MSKPDALYLLLGPEEGEKDAFIRRLLDGIARRVGEPPEVHRYYSFENALPEALAVLRNGTLFSRHRVVLLRGVEELRRKAELDPLAEYCAAPAPETTLVMISEEVGRVNARLQKLVPKENVVIFWELFESQKRGWVVNYFRQKEMEIDPQAADFLLDMVENNTRELREVCQKLSLFFAAKGRVELADVEKILFHSKEENVFSLFDRLAQRDFPASLEVLDKILLAREAEPVQILAGLLMQVRRLLGLKRALEAGHPAQEALDRLGIRGKRNQKVYLEGCRHYSLENLRDIVRLVALFDRRARTLKAALQGVVLQMFLYYALVAGRLPPGR